MTGLRMRTTDYFGARHTTVKHIDLNDREPLALSHARSRCLTPIVASMHSFTRTHRRFNINRFSGKEPL